MTGTETALPAIMGSAIYLFALLAIPAVIRNFAGPVSGAKNWLTSLIVFVCASAALLTFVPTESLIGPAVPRIMGAIIGGIAAFILVRALPATEQTHKSKN